MTGKPRKLNLILLFLAIALLLVMSFVFIYAIGGRASQVADDLLQRQSVIQRLDAIVTTTTNAETGQRGYLLTGDERYLTPYTNALAEVHSRISALQKAAAAGSIASEDMANIDQLISAKLSELAQTVNLMRQKRPQEALAIVESDQGRQLMDDLREACGKLVAVQQVQLDNDLSETISGNKIRTWIYAGGLLVNLAFR